MRQKSFPLWVAATTAAMVLAGCGSQDSDNAASQAATTSSPSGSPESVVDDCLPVAAAADVKPLSLDDLGPGEHSTDQLGTEVTFRLEETWGVPVSDPGSLVLQAYDPPVPFTRAVMMLREVELAGAGDLTVDIDAFVRTVPTVEATNQRDVTVGGSDATVVDLTATSEEPLLLSGVGTIVLRPTEIARLWVVDQGDQPPIVLFAPVGVDDTDWLATADAVVASIELGEPVSLPGSMADCSAEGFYTTTDFTLGQFSVDQYMGAEGVEPMPGLVVFELPSESPGTPPAVVFAGVTQTADGTALPDREAFLDEVVSRGGTVEPAGEIMLMGEQVTGYVTQNEALGRLSLQQGDGDPEEMLIGGTPFGTDYLVDTEDGLMLVATAAQTQEGQAEADLLLDLMSESFGWTE